MRIDSMKYFGIAAVLALFTFAGVAAESKSEFARAQEMIKAKDPKGFEEIRKLAETDMNEAMNRLRRLALQYRVNLPSSGFAAAGDSRSERGGVARNGGRGGFNRGGFGRGGFNRGGFGRGGFNRGGMTRNGGRGGFNRDGMMMGGFGGIGKVVAEYEIDLIFPKETDGIAKLQVGIEKKYAELAAKAGIKWDNGVDSKLRQLRVLDEAGFAAAVAAYKENPRNGFTMFSELARKHNIELMPRRSAGSGQRGEARENNARQIARPNFAKLREKYPEEMKKYEALRGENPEEARKFLEELIRKSGSN